jgi:K+-transporting ATPase c subunit
MNHRGLWLTAGVLAVIVLLAQAAGASTRDETASIGGSASVQAEITSTTLTVSLPEQASATATEKSANGIATANQAITERGRTTETTENEVTVNAPAAAPKDMTTGARPGWGCGDTNHKHSGPPGRPGATPPPGCAGR